MKKITTPYKNINIDVIELYSAKVNNKWERAIARKVNDNTVVWTQEGRGKVATLLKSANEVSFEML